LSAQMRLSLDLEQVFTRLGLKQFSPLACGVAQDVTSRKTAEAEIAKHWAAAEAARAEADALRKATLTLTENLRMDALLDTLLQTLRTIVPTIRPASC